MNKYRIEKLKKDTVTRIIKISDYVNNKESLKLRIKVVKQIKDELDIIDRGLN